MIMAEVWPITTTVRTLSFHFVCMKHDTSETF